MIRFTNWNFQIGLVHDWIVHFGGQKISGRKYYDYEKLKCDSNLSYIMGFNILKR